jgi:hypothetical protein
MTYPCASNSSKGKIALIIPSFEMGVNDRIPIDFVQREQASERSLWRFFKNRPRPLGVLHNVTKKH